MRISDWSSDVCSSDLDDKPQVPTCVVNAAVYNASGKLRDISLDEISDVLANDDDSFVWVGVYEPEDAVLDKLQEERSEEHTAELQSLMRISYAVFCLKKKNSICKLYISTITKYMML